MTSEAIVIAALGLLGAALSLSGLRLAVLLRRMRERLIAEFEARERLTAQIGEIGAARARAAEAREASEALRRDVAHAKGEASSFREQIEQLKMDLLRASATASDAMSKRVELEARVASLTAVADATERSLHEHAEFGSRARDEASSANERVTRLEKQLADTQKKLAVSQSEGARLSDLASKAELGARANGVAADEARALRAELDRARSAREESEASLKKSVGAAEGELQKARAELAQARSALAEETQKREDAERRAAAVPASLSPASLTSASAPKPGVSAVAAALDIDPALNRGQRETLRMMYDKFTAKTGKA